MTVMIEPGLLAGAVTPPSSKSQAHRLLIARALAGENLDDPAHRADSQDIRATRDCLKSLREGEGKLPVLECGESGSTLRFLIPVALALRGGGVFRGRGRLMDRPQEPYFRIFDGMGITHRREGDSLTVRGRLRPGEYPMPGDVSSQFVTGLLFALPLLEGESIIRLTSPLESRGYVDMTLQVLRDRGIRVEELPEGFRVPGGQQYGRGTLGEEADYSQAAFWLPPPPSQALRAAQYRGRAAPESARWFLPSSPNSRSAAAGRWTASASPPRGTAAASHS